MWYEQSKKNVLSVEFCITCGQCVAVCPSTVLDNIKVPLVN
ncbi:4Fe-4S dicluster domain-containing protein [Megasphaera sueciensis]